MYLKGGKFEISRDRSNVEMIPYNPGKSDVILGHELFLRRSRGFVTISQTLSYYVFKVYI